MDKILTIVVPTYNMEVLLEKDLMSLVVNMKLMEFLEILIVNDGSKDASSMIGHKFQEVYPNTFRIIDKPNGNYGSCINRGLKEARGKYIKIMDADDTYEKDGLEKLIELLMGTDYDLVLTDVIVDFVKKKKQTLLALDLQEDKVLSFEQFSNCNTNLLSMHAITYKTELLRSICYMQTEGISYTDQEWLFMPMIAIETVYYLKQPVYHYNIGRDGQTMDRKTVLKSVSQREKILCRMFEQISDSPVSLGHAHIKYLTDRMKFMIRRLYEDYIVKTPMSNSKELIVFDNKLKEFNLDLYSWANSLKMPLINKYYYVDAWRRQSKLRMIPVNVYGAFFRLMAKVL